MAGTGICPTRHRDDFPYHVPTQCPMLVELNLKLITCLPAGGKPAPAPGPAPAHVPAPTPGGCAAVADALSVFGSSGSSTAPFGLTAAVAPAPSPAVDYESEDNFHWDGDNLGVEYDAHPKVNMHVATYSPSCSHVSVISSISESALLLSLQAHQPCLSSALQQLLKNLSLLPVVQLSIMDGWLSLTLGPLTTWSLTNHVSSVTNRSPVFQSKWATTPTILCLP